MTPLTGDDLMTALVPLAVDLVACTLAGTLASAPFRRGQRETLWNELSTTRFDNTPGVQENGIIACHTRTSGHPLCLLCPLVLIWGGVSWGH